MISHIKSFFSIFFILTVVLALLFQSCSSDRTKLLKKKKFISVYAELMIIKELSIDEQEKVFVIKDFTPFPTGCCIEELNVELERISYSPDDLDKIREASYILVNSIKNRDWDKEFVDDRTGYT